MIRIAKKEKQKAPSQLGIGDRIEIIKSKRGFSLIFPLSMLLLLVALFVILTGGDFFTLNVIKGIFNQSLIVGTMATAVSFIYTTGNVDISVGNVMGLSAVFGALSYRATGSMVLVIIVTLLCGVLFMMCNCALGIVFHIKSAMVAIVAMSVYNAFTEVLVGPDPIQVDYRLCKQLEGNFRYIAFLLYFGTCLLLYHKTAIGRKLRFIGGNALCANQTGINSAKSKITAYLFAGIGVGLAGVLQLLRTGNVAQSVGTGMGVDVMLATVLGGMSIFGGAKSNVYAGFIGAVTVTTLNKGFLMVGVSSTLIQGVRAIIFLLLVFMNSERQATLPSRQQF